MIERGDCKYLNHVIYQTEYEVLDYEKTVKKLIRAYKTKLLRTKPPDARVEQANHSQTEPSQKLKCSVYKKYHHGPHDYIMVRRISQKVQVPMKLQLQQHQNLKQRW
jgi:hypothetical protein